MKRIAAIVLFTTGLATLLGLGIWQHERMQWKNAIIDDLNAQYAALPARSAVLTRAAMEEAAARQHHPFLIGRLSGRFIRNKPVFIGPRRQNGRAGYELVAPLQIDDGIVLVHLGWVAEEDRATLPLPHGRQLLDGVARKPDYSRFAGRNSPVHEVWSHLNIGQIATARALGNVAPLVFYTHASAAPMPEGLVMDRTRWYPRNKHLHYMIFWFAMAGAWIGVFTLAWKRRRPD